jgi:hypothetical protein
MRAFWAASTCDLHCAPSNPLLIPNSFNLLPYIESEVLTAVAVMCYVFLDIKPWSPSKVNRRFGGTPRLHLQLRRTIQTRNQHEAGSKVEAACPSETSVDSQRTIRRCIPQNRTVDIWRVLSLIATCFTLVSFFAYSSTLNMEPTFSSETTVDFQRPTRRYILEDRTLHNHRCENLRSYRTVHLSVSCISLLRDCPEILIFEVPF